MLEAVYVTTTLELGPRYGSVAGQLGDVREGAQASRSVAPRHPAMAVSWADLDDVDLHEVFDQRVPMLRSCFSHFFRGRLRNSVRTVLEKSTGDEVTEERAWT